MMMCQIKVYDVNWSQNWNVQSNKNAGSAFLLFNDHLNKQCFSSSYVVFNTVKEKE